MRITSIIVGIITAFVIVSAFNMAYATSFQMPKCNGNNNCNETYVDESVNNTNRNTNRNTNLQGQAQGQAQLQGQAQAMGQSQTGTVTNDISIKDQRQTVQTIIDFNHITPDIGKTSADLVNTDKAGDVKAFGIYWRMTAIALAHAKKMAADSSDVEILESVMFENNFRTNMMRKGESGMLMGTITLVSDGGDVTADGMYARAMLKAMELGATHYELLESSASLVHEGSKAGIDLGGAGSVAVKSDGSAVVAPGATLGYSKAWSSNEYRPSMVFILYFDESVIR